MPKHHILIDPSKPMTPKRCKPPPSINWDICVLCKEVTNDALQCPFKSTKQPIGSGYASLAEDLLQFQTLQHMPMDFNLDELDDGNGIEYTLKANKAVWHKKWRLKFNKKAFEEQNKRESCTVQQPSYPSLGTRSAHIHPPNTEPICFFCNEPAGSAGLHNASTYSIDTNVPRIALELQETALLAKLAAGDMIAIEAKYHHDCLRRLYNRGRKVVHKSNDEDDSCLHGTAFAELVAFLEGTNSDDDSAPVFKLTNIAQMYKTRVEQLGGIVATRIHTTRLKQHAFTLLD